MKLAALALVALVSCSGGGSGGSSAPSATTPTVDGTFTGGWSNGSIAGIATVIVTDDGHDLNVKATLTGSPCFDSLSGSGSVKGGDVKVKLKDAATGAHLQLRCTALGYPNAVKITGTYEVLDGSCAGDFGSIIVNLQAPAPDEEPATRATLTRDVSGDLEVFTLLIAPSAPSR